MATIDAEIIQLRSTLSELTNSVSATARSIQALQSPLANSLNSVLGSFAKSGIEFSLQIRERQRLEAQRDEFRSRILGPLTPQQQARFDIFNARIDATNGSLRSLGTTLAVDVAGALKQFVDSVRQTQKQFGISAGLAASLQTEALGASIKSLLPGGGTFVGGTAIQEARAAFQDQFGGVLTTEAATELAQRAKDLGVSAKTLADARRQFLTTGMGDLNTAKATEERTLEAFKRQGMTQKTAYELIAQYSELYARNGNRFADSFTRAAADAKKIGVDLNKIDQVGDNIIDNFEGFLESQAELGAMGFGFDSATIARIAETGDTGALEAELRSQLAAQGKDLTNLRRSQQLALSKAFGIPISEIQRMAGKTPEGAGGEKKLSPEELQNKTTTILIDRLEKLTISVVALTTAMTLFNTGKMLSSVGSALGAIVPALGRIGPALATIAPALGMAAGAAGIAGGVTTGTSIATGMGASAGASLLGAGIGTAIGAAIGTAIAPGVGTMIGAQLGGMAGGYVSGAVSKPKPVSDVALGPAPGRMITGPEGSLQLGPKDAIFAGTKITAEYADKINEAKGYEEAFKAASLPFAGKLAFSGIPLLSKFGKNVMFTKFLKANPYLNAATDIGISLAKGEGIQKSLISGTGSLVGGLLGSFLGPAGTILGSMGGSWLGEQIADYVAKPKTTTASSPITPKTPAVAPSMMMQMPSIQAPAVTNINMDTSRLENKLDKLAQSFSNMNVHMDGTRVGKVLYNASDAAATVGVFGIDSRQTL